MGRRDYVQLPHGADAHTGRGRGGGGGMGLSSVYILAVLRLVMYLGPNICKLRVSCVVD